MGDGLHGWAEVPADRSLTCSCEGTNDAAHFSEKAACVIVSWRRCKRRINASFLMPIRRKRHEGTGDVRVYQGNRGSKVKIICMSEITITGGGFESPSDCGRRRIWSGSALSAVYPFLEIAGCILKRTRQYIAGI